MMRLVYIICGFTLLGLCAVSFLRGEPLADSLCILILSNLAFINLDILDIKEAGEPEGEGDG